jgi:pimeloyl-ACP methyl ester carboxylesterase
LSSAVADWLVATGRQRSVVVGHSVGCHVVADLASHAGHLAGPIVLAAPVVDARRRPWPHHLVPLAHDVIRGGPRWWGLWSMLALDLLASGGVWSLRHYDHLVEHPLATTARRLPGTTVVIRGAGDPLSPPDLVRDVAAAAPGGRLVEVPGARHLVHWTHAAEVARAISPLLRR